MNYWWILWVIIGLLVAAAIGWVIWYYWKVEEASTPLEPPIQPIGPASVAVGLGKPVDEMHQYGVGEDGKVHSVDEPCASGLHHPDGSYTSSNVLYPGSYVMPSHYMTRGYSPNWGLGWAPPQSGAGGYGTGLTKRKAAMHPGLDLIKQPAALARWYQEHSTPEVPLWGHGSGQNGFGSKGYWEGFSNPVQYP